MSDKITIKQVDVCYIIDGSLIKDDNALEIKKPGCKGDELVIERCKKLIRSNGIVAVNGKNNVKK